MSTIIIKRIYDPISESDGFRVLVDRLWPRGISREKADIAVWTKSVAPTSALRKEYHQNQDRFDVFYEKYSEELRNNHDTVPFVILIKKKLSEGNVTFLTAAKIKRLNHAHVLKDWVERGDEDT